MVSSKHEGNAVRYIEITSLSLVFKGVSKLFLFGIPSSPADVRIWKDLDTFSVAHIEMGTRPHLEVKC